MLMPEINVMRTVPSRGQHLVEKLLRVLAVHNGMLVYILIYDSISSPDTTYDMFKQGNWKCYSDRVCEVCQAE